MYGNPDTRVSIEQVQALRDGTAQATAQPDLLRPVRIGLAILFVVALFMVWRLLRRKLIRT